MEETGRNSVMPSTTPRMSGGEWISHARVSAGSGASFFFAEEGAEDGLGFELALLDFELAENGLETDVDFVPMIFQAAQGAFVAVAEVAEGGRRTDQGHGLPRARGRCIRRRR